MGNEQLIIDNGQLIIMRAQRNAAKLSILCVPPTPNPSLLTTNLSTSPYIVNYTLLIINYILPPPPS
jgi:hypothetical protein